VDRLKINGSLAREALKDLEEKGLIKKVVGHSKLSVYSELPFPCLDGMGWDGMANEGRSCANGFDIARAVASGD
jgi:hypothetical protein